KCRRRLLKEALFRKRLRQGTRGPNDALRLKQVIGTKVQCAQSQSKMSGLSARQDRSFGALELRPMLINVPIGLSINRQEHLQFGFGINQVASMTSAAAPKRHKSASLTPAPPPPCVYRKPHPY